MDWKERLNTYRKLYAEINDDILNHRPDRYLRDRGIFSTVRRVGLSPIEEIVWDDCRFTNVVVYPQYPIGNLMVDFCNPVKKIIIECDGKDYHNIQKDKNRDWDLIEKGYKVFRLSGSTIVRETRPIQDKIDWFISCSYEDDEPELIDLYRRYYVNTSEGFLFSLKHLLFSDNCFDEDICHFDYKLESLMTNRLVNSFQVLPPYKKR